jgi:dipeptidyl aminopeptidase/acylaminoacyl peptidase
MIVRKFTVAMAAAMALSFGAVGVVLAQNVPVEAYAALPAVSSVAVSDNGEEIAYLRRSGETAHVIVQARSGEVLVTVDVSDRRPSRVFWVSKDHVAIESLVLNSDLVITTSHFPQLDIVNVRTKGVARVLRSADKGVINAVFDHWRGDYRGEPTLYVQAVTSEAYAYTNDVYRIDLDSGRGRRIATGLEDTQGYLVRPNGDIAVRIARSKDSSRIRLTAPNGSGGWRTVFEQESSLDGPGIWGFAQDPDKIVVSTLDGTDVYLTEISLSTGEAGERRLQTADTSGPMYDRNQRLVGVGTVNDDMNYTFYEPRLEQAWNVLVQGLPDKRLRLTSFNDDFSTVVVRSEGDTDAGTFYLYDATARSVSVVGRAYPDVPQEGIASVSMVSYAAADGMELYGYLTLPRGRAARDLPLVLLPHGGPASRDYARFDWWAQALASRGYAVFQPQFRGSDGFGEAYLQAGYGEWGRKMQSDLTDGIDYLAGRGLIDPQRVCVVGASYGGYAALAGATMQPDAYLCAVSVAGVADLRQMLRAEARAAGYGSQSRNPVIRYWNRFMGGEGYNDQSLDERSPAKLVSNIKAPVLLLHGRNDTVVPYEQSEIMQRAMRAAGKEVELVTLEDEDHWLSFPATRRQMLTATIEFLEEHNPPR